MHALSGLSGLSGIVQGGASFFTDDFNDGVLDPRWTVFGGTVVEQNSRAELGSGSVFGFTSTYNFGADKYISFKQTTPHSTFFRFYLDGGAVYLEMRMQPDAGLAHSGFHDAGGDEWLVADTNYDPAVYQYLKFAYNSGAAKWQLFRSADGVTWTLITDITDSMLGGVGHSACYLQIYQVGAETTFFDSFDSNLL